MGRGTDQSIAASEITKIVSTVMATMESSNAVLVSNNDLIIQLNKDSDNCKNRSITFQKDTYVSTGTVFTSEETVQTMYANIVNQLSAELDSDVTGSGFGPGTQQQIAATIQNMLANTLTTSTIMSYVSSINNTNISIQVCYGSKNSTNFIFGSYNDVYNFYYDQYSQMAQVQQVSADIANTLDASASSKKTGILAVITRMIALVCIVIIIIIGIVIVIIAFGMFGSW